MVRRLVFAAAIFALAAMLAFSVIAPVAAAPSTALSDHERTGNETAANETEPNETVAHEADTEPYSIEELRSGGREVSGAGPSTRWLSDTGSVYVDYSGHNPVLSEHTEDWEAENLLENGALVRVNDLTIHATRERSAETRSLELVVVYWEPETVEHGNETITRANVHTEEQTEFTLEGAFDRETVSLQRSDEERHVTMWLETSDGDRVDGAQWTFRHDSIATTADAGVGTEGEYLWRAIKEFLVPIAIGSFGVGMIGNRAVKRAGAGPQWGYLPWIIALTIGTFVGVAWQFDTLAELVVGAPLIAALYLTGIVGIVVLESDQSSIKETLFVRPHLVDASNPRGEEIVDTLLADATGEKLVELENGAKAVVRPGFLPFLSRVFGGRAVLDPSRPITTELNLVESEWDQMVFVDPDADETLDYEPEGWKLEVPSVDGIDDGLRVATLAMVGLGVTVLVGSSLSWPWGIGAGLALALAYCATPTETSATVEPASGHDRAAFVSMMYLAHEHDDAETIESARKKLIQEKARGERDVDAALEEQDATLIETMFGSDVDRTLVDEPEREPEPSTSRSDPLEDLEEVAADD